MKSMWQNTCLFEKRPKLLQETSGTMFLRHDLKFFLEFQKKNWFAISETLKMTIQNYFFVKKVFRKKSPMKFDENFFSKKEHIRAHATEYEIHVTKYLLVWKKTRAASGNVRKIFLRPNRIFFLEFLKKNPIPISITLKINIQNYFFVKKSCQKNLTSKLVKKVVKNFFWKSTFFHQKN